MKIKFQTMSLISVIMALMSLQAWGQDTVQKPKTKIAPTIQGVQEQEVSLPKLLDLGAKACIPCKKMAPILEQMEKDYKGVLDVEFIDVWQPENKERAMKHNVESIPTQIFFDANGKELWRHEGFMSKEDLLNKWTDLGYVFKLGTAENHDKDPEA